MPYSEPVPILSTLVDSGRSGLQAKAGVFKLHWLVPPPPYAILKIFRNYHPLAQKCGGQALKRPASQSLVRTRSSLGPLRLQELWWLFSRLLDPEHAEKRVAVTETSIAAALLSAVSSLTDLFQRYKYCTKAFMGHFIHNTNFTGSAPKLNFLIKVNYFIRKVLQVLSFWLI